MNEIFKRHSVKHYKDIAVEDEKIQQLLRAGMQAPSGGNQQEWEFIVVTDKAILQKLALVGEYSSPAGRAPLAIVTLGNTDKMRFPELWTHDMGAVCENILLEAVTLGLGGVWMSIDPTERRIFNTKQLFDLPDNIKPFSIIAIGYPITEPELVDRFNSDVIFYNKYGN